MNKITEIETQLDAKEDYALSLELDILSTQEQIYNEEDETHIIFLTDHLNTLKFELDKVNIDLYFLRKKVKKLENEKKFLLN